VDAIIADAPMAHHPVVELSAVRVAVPTTLVLDDMDETIGRVFERALAALAAAGARLDRIAFPEFARVSEINARGTIVNAESFAIHSRAGLFTARERYDPNVRTRIEIGERMTAADYSALITGRARLITDANARSAGYDALVFPAVACVAPRFADIADPGAWTRANGMMLRNASLVNMLDRCALSLPMHRGDELPAGFMIVGDTMGDARLLAIGDAVERVLAKVR
jgi:aspartyl-tRNA(Asn)/glutamyl-tRNA(Gln) amidotransferase subunit A